MKATHLAMSFSRWACILVSVHTLLSSPAFSQPRAPVDTIITNAKVITVDDSFSVKEAVAIADGRIVAVGRNPQIRRLAGPSTRRIDAGGRTVIPGLIDNHAHFVRAAEKWHLELRLDNVTSRADAVRRLGDRVRISKPGEWIVTLGGWAEPQFRDYQHAFSRAELDEIAPANPVVLQTLYTHTVLNSTALRSTSIDSTTPDPENGQIVKDVGADPNLSHRDRGRDAGYPAPPAQIRTCPIRAYGSYLGYLTARRSSGQG